MNESLRQLLPYFLPPLLGAAIGYVTNFIAIRMLFRPLSEKRILGVRIPLTPGIIPRQRYQLSQSIARMVSEQLLTEETVQTHLETPRFRKDLRTSVQTFTDDVLDAVPGEHLHDDVRTLVSGFERAVGALLERFIQSDAFEETGRTMVERAVGSIWSLPLGEIVPDHETLLNAVKRVIGELTAGSLRENVWEAIETWLSRQLEEDLPMETFISDELLEELPRLVSGIYEPSYVHVMKWLDRPDVRKEMSVRGKVVLREILDKLSFVQRFIVTAAQYDRQLSLRMPEIVDDLVDMVRDAGADPENKKRVIEGVVDAVKKIQSQSMREAAARGNLDVTEIARRIYDEVMRFLGQEGVRERATSAAENFISHYEERGTGEVLSQLLGTHEKQLTDYIWTRVHHWLHRPQTVSLFVTEVGRIGRSFMVGMERRSLRTVISVSSGQKMALDIFVTRQIHRMIEMKLPSIIQTLNIHQVVVNKIDSLDVLDVERLLLSVIARHLKWINLFGALLGALIGGSQVLLTVLS